MTRWFVERLAETGCQYYRRTLPLRYLSRFLADRGVLVDYSRSWRVGHRYSAMLGQRYPDVGSLQFFKRIKELGAKLIWDLDDDLFDVTRDIPELREEAQCQIDALWTVLEWSDMITVSTPSLGRLVGMPEKTRVLPNLICLRDNPIQSNEWNEGKRTILYAGTPSHEHDVELLKDVYLETRKEYRWVWHGCHPKWLDKKTLFMPLGRVCDYQLFCQMVKPDLCLAPLLPCRFNDCKSPIKLWEYATLDSCVLASNTGPYVGHVAAMVPEGEPFTVNQMYAAMAIPNASKCLEIAEHNSWSHGHSGRAKWIRAFDKVAEMTGVDHSHVA